MKLQKFKTFLTESKAGKNLHMTHVEDLILLDGLEGARKTFAFLSSLVDMLSGYDKKNTDITVKWDGAPAIFAGTNPENGKFFVGTKSIFNVDAKLNYTPEDIDANHSGALADKLKVALVELKKLGIQGVLQGDMMFTKGDLTAEVIDDKKYVVFRPNTIAYAVPADSDLARKIQRANIGVVFHTTYSGPTMSQMTAGFGADISKLRKSDSAWIQDAYYKDYTGKATFDGGETAECKAIMSKMGKDLHSVSSSKLKELLEFLGKYQVGVHLMTFNNSQIRTGKIHDRNSYVQEYVTWARNWWIKQGADKSPGKKTKMEEFLNWVKANAEIIIQVLDFQNDTVEIKNKIIAKLNKIEGLGTFLKTGEGFKVTNPEGFVAIQGPDAVKLVDRLEFSRANFTAEKNWSK